MALSKELEREALAAGGAAMVLSCFQHARHLVPSTLERYAELARAGSMVAMLGAGIDMPPVPRHGTPRWTPRTRCAGSGRSW